MVSHSLPELEKTGIKITKATKNELDEIKIIPEEPYDKVVQRLIVYFREHEEKDMEVQA